MRRVLGALAGLLLAVFLVVPAVAGADPSLTHSGRILVSTQGDISIPAGDHYDVVVVVNGNATIAGEVNTVVVVDGTLAMTGALTETVVAVRSPVTLGPGTIVRNDLLKLDALVTRTGDAQVQGQVRDIGTQLAGAGFILGPLFILMFLGFAVATLAAALLVAALGARQVRAAEGLITHRPVETLLTGIAGLIVPVFLLVGLFMSIIGAPLALGLMFVVWPLVAFLGYIVAGIWIGDWVLQRLSPTTVHERPYLAAVVGLVILAVLAVLPILPAIASLFGYGAVILLSWRTFRGHQESAEPAPTVTRAPLAV